MYIATLVLLCVRVIFYEPIIFDNKRLRSEKIKYKGSDPYPLVTVIVLTLN